MSQQDKRSALSQFGAEMRRRHVVRFSLGYAAAAFVILQLAEIVFPAFGLGENALRILVILVALGFLPAAVLAWVFDVTADGITRTEDDVGNSVIPKLALLVVGVAVVSGLGVWLAIGGVFAAPQAGGPGNSGAVQFAEFDPTRPIRSIAVLPLNDFSPDGGQEYFTAGMHEELIAKLSQLDELRVVSRTSVMQYVRTTKSAPEIGRELGVEVLVEGSVTRSGDQIRITLQFIHAPSDSHILNTLQFDREAGNALALQTEIAHAVAREINSEHEEDLFEVTAMNVEPATQEAYLMGKHEYERGTPEGYRMALEYFEDAVKNDPDFAPAMTGMAGARFLVDMEDGEMDLGEAERARTEAASALAMDTESVEAAEVLSFIESSMPAMSLYPPSAASGAGQRVQVVAVPGTPDSITVDMGAFDSTWVSALTGLGQHLEDRIRRGTVRAGRGGPQQEALTARQLMGAGRFMEAQAVLESVIADAPDLVPAWEMLVRTQVSEGNAAGAVNVVTRWQESGAAGSPDQPRVVQLRDAVADRGVQGYWSWTLDGLESAQREGRNVAHTELAAASAGSGDHDAALEHLTMALEQGERGLLTLRSDPVWDELRGDDRFKALAQQARSLRFSPTRNRPTGRGRGGGN